MSEINDTNSPETEKPKEANDTVINPETAAEPAPISEAETVTETTQTSESVQTTESDQVIETTQPSESAQTTDPDQVTETTQPSESTQATEPDSGSTPSEATEFTVAPTNIEHLEPEGMDEQAATEEQKINLPLDAQEKKAKKEKKEKKEKGEKHSTPPIIKKVKKHGHGHHGGAWKIAFADFVTAMMAFFLLMWLVASLNKAQKAGIADYFKQPIKVALFGGEAMGDRKMNIIGGGLDVTAIDGQVSATNKPTDNEKTAAKKESSGATNEELKKLEELKSQINLSIDKDPALAGLKKQLRMDVVSDGLRIQLIDNQKKPMFDVGSEKVNPEVIPILANIAKLLNSVPNKISIQGHTDANPYNNPEELEFTNWELSSRRANAARRALIKAGMNEDKVMTVTGFSSTVLLDKGNPYNPENRRISIIVMKKGAQDKITTNK